MSSKPVRDVIFNVVEAAASPWPTFDLSDYHDFNDVLSNIDTQAVLLQFVTADEQMVTIGGEGNQGWEESGSVVIHLVTPTGFDSGPVITKGDEIRHALRGTRPAPSITIESIAPFVDAAGDSVGVEGAWHGYAAPLIYVRRDCG